jgi:hypothetical protein
MPASLPKSCFPAIAISIFSGYNQEAVDYLSPNAKAAIKHFVSKPIGLEALSVLLAEMLKKDIS